MKLQPLEKPKNLVISYTYGTSRAAETHGWNLVTAVTEVHTASGYERVKHRECGGGYDMLGCALAGVINKIFAQELQELLQSGKTDLKRPTLEGGRGYEYVVHMLSQYLGYKVTHEYARDRQGRPKYKTAAILTLE